MNYQSWGRYPYAKQQGYKLDRNLENFSKAQESGVLPYGNGRSYGDSCLNSPNLVMHTARLDRFINFDVNNGVIRCESGVKFKDIIDVVLPQGWFLPVTPGTKYVTVGGAIANDVHGKNHHVDGNFGHFVKRFELLRSNGEKLLCSATENQGLFYATIGGLGLTGLIVWADIQLKPVSSGYLDVETICYSGLDEFKQLSDESKSTHLYTVAWVDCMAKGKELGRGIFLRANHSSTLQPSPPKSAQKAVPIDFPSFALNSFTIKLFNQVYYANGKRKHKQCSTDWYDPYFYPLDGIGNWNRIYGRKGFLQYQFVVPSEDYTVIKSILEHISDSGAGSFLAVLKEFGDIESLGMLSFPRKGVCLALDFPYQGDKTIDLLRKLDIMVCESGGAVYPAKDACMTPESFRSFYPNIDEFKKYKDEQFSSDFWRRVTGE